MLFQDAGQGLQHRGFFGSFGIINRRFFKVVAHQQHQKSRTAAEQERNPPAPFRHTGQIDNDRQQSA